MKYRERFEKFERWTDLPLAFLALLIVPALILEESAQSVHLRTLAIEINWCDYRSEADLRFVYEAAAENRPTPREGPTRRGQ